MNIQDLMAGADLPREILECIDDLLIKKAATRELGRGVAPPPIAEFVSGELRKAEENFNKAKPATDESRERAEIFFRWAIERYALD